jgi:nicotinate-nucleotide pyrophosphorylase (carboxylating)
MASPSVSLDPADYRDLVRRALAEDLGSGDLTSNAIVGPEQRGRGTLLAKSPCTLAGLEIALEAFRQADPAVRHTFHCRDGDAVEAGSVIGEISGAARALLLAERTALNFLQHLSGIATLTRRTVEAGGGRIAILDTRKTMPTFRRLEKYAVRVGGGTNHRFGLDDGILIKENHIRLAGGIGAAVERARAAAGGLPIEVETQTLDDVEAALAAGAPAILLDNMALDEIRESVRRIAGRATVEVSGGVTRERVPELASTGADCASSGALTQSAPASDISFEIEPA